MTIPIRGTAALVVALAIVAATAIWMPAYRWWHQKEGSRPVGGLKVLKLSLV